MSGPHGLGLQMAPVHVLQGLFIVAIWGVNVTAVKFGTEGFPPVMMTALRFLIVAVLLAPFLLQGTKGKFKELLLLALVMGVGHFSLFFAGVSGVDASAAVVVLMLGVPMSAILASIVLKDHLGWGRSLGLGLAFLGVVIIAGEPRTASNIGHIWLLVGCVFFWSLGNIIVKKLGEVNIFWMTAWMAVLASPILVALSLVLETGQAEALSTAPWTAWTGILFAAIGGSIVAYGLWYRLIKIYSVTKVTPMTLTEPLFGVAAGWWLLSEPVGWEKIIGAAVTTLGVGIIMMRWKKAPPITD